MYKWSSVRSIATATKFSVNFATGNVGIGGVVPTTQLDVNGQVKIRGGSPAVDKVLASDANGLATWKDVTTITGAHTTDTNAGTQCTAGQYLDGDGTCKAIPSSSSTSKYALAFTAADGLIPQGGVRYIGQGNTYEFTNQATFIVPFDSTVTNLAALQANGNADTTTTYTLINLVGNTVVMTCIASGTLTCSASGSADVTGGFPLVIKAESTCAAGASCPNIQFANVAIGLKEK